MLAPDGIRSNYVPARVPQDPPRPDPRPSIAASPPPAPAQRPDRDVNAAADRVMDAGERSFWKDDYEKRMDVFAQEMAQGNQAFRAQLTAKILERDDGAFDSWLQGDRLNSRLDSGHIHGHERAAVIDGFKGALEQGLVKPDRVGADFVRETHDSGLIASYMKTQNLNDRDGFNRALKAFSGVEAGAMSSFAGDPANKGLMRDFTLSTQQHQDWYESQTVDMLVVNQYGFSTTHDAPVSFSKDQLSAMRTAFKADGLMTNGELLLAYPDRLERNEQVTRQYKELSDGMAGIVGKDNANWASFAVSASDEIGRNLKGAVGIELSEAVGGDPRYWLSVGNSRLVSDIGPGFEYFVSTFKDGKNRDMSFDDFYKGFEEKWGGRGISYLDGKRDPELDMKNAFKAYYDAMKLNDREQMSPLSPAGRADLAEQRGKLMLYANTLVGLQEQEIVQPEIENGLSVLGITNPGGSGAWGIDLHIPEGKDGRKFDTDIDQSNTANRVNLGGGTFTTVDGKTIDLDRAIRDRLNGLDGDAGNEDEANVANSGTDHWESYSQRMGYIYHLFANQQRNPAMFNDPRDVFGTRAKELENEPLQVIP